MTNTDPEMVRRIVEPSTSNKVFGKVHEVAPTKQSEEYAHVRKIASALFPPKPSNKEWEEEISYLIKHDINGFQDSDSRYKNRITKVLLIDLVKQILLSQKEESARLIQSRKFTGQYAHDGDVYSPNEINKILDDIASRIKGKE